MDRVIIINAMFSPKMGSNSLEFSTYTADYRRYFNFGNVFVCHCATQAGLALEKKRSGSLSVVLMDGYTRI